VYNVSVKVKVLQGLCITWWRLPKSSRNVVYWKVCSRKSETTPTLFYECQNHDLLWTCQGLAFTSLAPSTERLTSGIQHKIIVCILLSIYADIMQEVNEIW